MKKAFLIYGSTGAGKSTYAMNLAKKYNAQIFSIDEWMKNLFWKDAPEKNTLDWALVRVERCESQIWLLASRLLSENVNVIFDLGFSKKKQRDKIKNLLETIECTYESHFLDISSDVRWDRVLKRNTEKTDTFQFEVTKETFEWMESYFERPSEEELEGAVIIKK